MKQKIKKLSYTIPLKSNLFKKGSIEVSTFDIPGQKDKNMGAVSIKIKVDEALRDATKNENSIMIPRRQIKALRKALKKIQKKS
ncbi:hypothetical protein LS70_008025 [Helicobacter sp. MIT 11-5569]|uniref:hypothetical protein n=1 Tax=Helicobacter sp. MIT 11-5569 TaxID=1548151 RepID=UPI00051FC981|nr:hypothetical protein [Helicobacter sp. MIT 11-5569]TLD81228.1 hypothetical protein LS70_008025 [Helicobacter sp. MIT 11-5569]